jgi:phosphoenolpyruvate carboxykinase (ATP)
MFNNIILNPTISELYKYAIQDDNLNVSSTGALLAYSGEKTGRSPRDKRVVYDENTKDIWWGDVNIPISPELFKYYKTFAQDYLKNKDKIFQIDVLAGWDIDNQVKIRLYSTSAYHALFIRNMLIPTKNPHETPDFVIYDVGELNLEDYTKLISNKNILDPKLKNTLIALNFTSMEMVIYGSKYAGEIKKGVLTLMMYMMPIKKNLTLHSSANIKDDNLCLFFGLSGTGKTTLSADSSRNLIGDDEHVWTDKGVFNIEGGCYAKCIKLSQEAEPEIYNAIKFGAVLENVTYDKDYKVNYDDNYLTENTRCVYPLDYIDNALIPAIVELHPKNIIFLTCDAFGVLPPVAKLNLDQAINFFVNGYTSKIPGTEVGITEPQATFSSCFGEPFLVWHPLKYGELLKEKLLKYNSKIWILNTGWVNGGYGVGQRVSIKDTRKILNCIHNNIFDTIEFEKFPIFDFEIPKFCPEVDNKILNPINSWESPTEFMDKLNLLFNKFISNYNKKINQ